jgi:repressor LexA
MASRVLTLRQETVLRYIQAFLAQRGYVPTLAEMAAALGVSSLQAVKDHLTALERKGYLRRFPGRRRVLELVSNPYSAAAGIPILGHVAAGPPLLAEENLEGRLPIGPPRRGRGTYFALRVEGDSMTGAGIQPRDYVVVRQQEMADPGDMVVALLGEEATVKFLRKQGARLVLEAANPAYAPIELTARVPPPRILGRVVGLYRDLEAGP